MLQPEQILLERYQLQQKLGRTAAVQDKAAFTGVVKSAFAFSILLIVKSLI
ncbi:hypothetical protein IQ264_20075 [Phormidium sp. LEGE 05292]|uniref:hypothetical protein n=1 Tax=[Phormidium] sp. LEGE 05292 TaxID=767427 RepID=UPI0018801381|nr:hypothetical protein [Phormidium sp. LEGE 05292]MBE9227725.1 hypothetical protein [Phormidium sp. LEGE 05292]